VSLAASDDDLRTGITRLAESVLEWGAGR
jgi:hypothetical protein